MTKWSHLPNAKHIDAVIASIKANPKAWGAARDAVPHAARVAAWHAARDAVPDSVSDGAGSAAWDTACEGMADMVPNGVWAEARYAVRDSILALVTYDHASKYLEMTSDQLRAWAALSEDPAAVLLIPAVVVVETVRDCIND